MNLRPYTLLLHPFFLIALVLLLVNDFYLKYQFHNWLTGKLSDFAGLFVFAVFLFVLFPMNRKRVIVFCAIFFCWWKSPLSSSLIYFFNDHLSLPLHRIVDYTDLSALVILPLTYQIKSHYFPLSFVKTMAIYCTGIISLFSFCSTSMVRRIQKNEVHMDKSFRTRLTEDEIIDKFHEKNLPVERDTAYYRKLSSYDKYLRIKDSTGKQKTIRIADYKEMELYERSVPFSPTYTIPRLIINNDTIRKIRFTIDGTYNRKKRVISLKSFELDTTWANEYYSSLRWLERKFEKPIKQKIEDILK